MRSAYTPEGFRRCLHPLLGMISEVPLVAVVLASARQHPFGQQRGGLHPGAARPATELGTAGTGAGRLGLFAMNGSWSFGRPSNCPHRGGPAASARPKPDQPGHPLAGKPTCRGRRWPRIHQAWGWARPRRVVLIRHRTSQRPEAGGRELISVRATDSGADHEPAPGVDGLRCGGVGNGRADCENIIKELANAYALPQLCLKRFYATEAALSLSVLAQPVRALPAPRRMGIGSPRPPLRMRLFTTGGIVSRTGAI